MNAPTNQDEILLSRFLAIAGPMGMIIPAPPGVVAAVKRLQQREAEQIREKLNDTASWPKVGTTEIAK